MDDKILCKLQCNGTALQIWFEVFDCLNTLCLKDVKVGEIVDVSLVAALEKLMIKDNLVKLWNEILLLKSEQSLKDSSSQLLHGFRLVGNYFRHKTTDTFQSNSYTSAIMNALVETIKKVDRSLLPCIASICYCFSSFAHRYFIVELFADVKMTAVVIAEMNPMWTLTSTKIYLNHFTQNPNRYANILDHGLIQLLISTLMEQISVVDIIDCLILAKPTCSLHAVDSIVLAIPTACIPELIDTVGVVWGDQFFISRGDINMQALLTKVLLAALTRSSREQLLTSVGSRNITIELVLTMGISNYLDVDNLKIRSQGLRVATAYAKLLGEELLFPELNNELTTMNTIPKNELVLCNNEIVTAIDNNKNVYENQNGPINDDDDDNDITGYDVEEDDDIGFGSAMDKSNMKILQTNYLRDCLISE